MFLAVLFVAVVPVVALASGLFGGSGSVFQSSPVINQKQNSQNMALLQAVSAPDGSRGSKSTLAIVSGTALLPESTTVESASSSSVSSDQISIYVVHPGDTLSEIATMFGVSKNTIIWANDLKGGKVTPGDQLVILPISGVEYTVKSGDTLKSIAKKFKGDVGEIASFNNISSDSDLSAGDTVIIPDGEIVSQTGQSKTYSKKTYASDSTGGDSSQYFSPKVGSRGPNSPVIIGYYMRPLLGGIKTQGIHGHNGVDLSSAYGTPIMASADGEVIIAKSGGWNGGYGSYIVIKHANGTQTLYGHLSQVDVTVGQTVSQGDVIGKMGSSGESTGTHLHFEIRGALNPF